MMIGKNGINREGFLWKDQDQKLETRSLKQEVTKDTKKSLLDLSLWRKPQSFFRVTSFCRHGEYVFKTIQILSNLNCIRQGRTLTPPLLPEDPLAQRNFLIPPVPSITEPALGYIKR